MSLEVEFGVAGGREGVYELDALDSFPESAESGVTMKIVTKPFTPMGPAGELDGKRMFLQVTHTEGFSVTVTPVVDGVRQVALKRFYNRFPVGGRGRRESLLIPLGSFRPRFGAATPSYWLGLRGSAYSLEIEATNPTAPFHLETLVVEANVLHAARARKAGE